MSNFLPRRSILLVSACLAVPAFAAPDMAAPEPGRTVGYAPASAWVVPPPPSSATPTPEGAPIRLVYNDNQVQVGTKDVEQYQAMRLHLLSPEALPVGNLSVTWAPAAETVVVNRVLIWRDGKSIDVLASQKFAVIQRENNLEQSMLDGNLTATLQIAGLQVGDELEFAITSKRRFVRAGERPETFMQFPVTGTLGTVRLRVVEPKGALAFYQAADVPKPVERPLGRETEHVFQMSDSASVTVPEGAPPRYALTRFVQGSGYSDWAAVSRMFAAPFDEAAKLSPTSPVKAEAARIAAASTDPVARAEAALKLVQNQVRYVYVGLNGGNYQPAMADETWTRRFGDCKAKTVLLIAVLRELGIAAEPVLVSGKGGDGTNLWLPTPTAFDHVVVRATVAGKPVWLDGTRVGDRSLANLEAPTSRWGLPLRATGAGLEPIAQRALRFPVRIEVVEIDASAGFDKPGKYRIQQTLRSDEIFGMRSELASLVPADANKVLTQYWRKQLPDVEATKTEWRFDDANRLLVLSMEGQGKVDWDGDAEDGRTHYLFGGGFMPPDEKQRPKDQPQDIPFATDFPGFSCYATTVKVPPADPRFHWVLTAKPMDRTLGGVAYWRISSFDGSVARLVKSRRVLTPEITAAEAVALNAAIDSFDNNKSYVWEKSGKTPATNDPKPGNSGNFGSFADFAGPAPPCQGSAG